MPKALPRFILTMACLTGLAGPLASLPPFESGLWERAEPIVIWMHAAAALAAVALLMAWQAWLPLQPRGQVALPVLAAAAGLWGFVAAIRLGQGMPHWLGAAQTGFGGMWHMELSLWLLAGFALLRFPAAWRAAVWSGIAVAAIVVLLKIGARFAGWSVLISISAYYGWLGFALPVIATAHRDDRLGRLRFGFACAAGAGLLGVSESLTMVAAAAAGLLVLGLGRFLSARSDRDRLFNRLAVIAILGAAILPFMLLHWPELTKHSSSLESRRLVLQILAAARADDPIAWVTGFGFGSTANSIAAHMGAIDAHLWDYQGWDALRRNYFHSHNWVAEHLHAGGVPGVLLGLALFLAIPLCASGRRRPLAAGFAVAYLSSLGLWFELAFVLPWFGLAVAALIGDEAAGPEPLSAPQWRPVVATALAGIAGLAVWAAIALTEQARGFSQVMAWSSGSLQMPPPVPKDRRGGDDALAEFIGDEIFRIAGRAILRHGAGDSADAARLLWLADALALRREQTQSALLLLAGERVFSETMLRQEMQAYRPALIARLDEWQKIVERALQLAPSRSDVSVGLFNHWFLSGNRTATLELSRRVLTIRPDDPVGLYFEGGTLVQDPDPARRARGLLLLRQALEREVERYLPVDPAIKRLIGRP